MTDLAKQWQVAQIWMHDANMHSVTCSLLDRMGRLSMAEFQLDRYFNMIEQALIDLPPCIKA